MQDKIVIGNSKKWDVICTAIYCDDIEGDHSISENRNAYWISHCILDLECTIYKDSVEGKKISKMRSEKKPISDIQEYIDKAILKRVDIKVVYNKIKELEEISFDKGKEMKQEEIKEVLGIYDY